MPQFIRKKQEFPNTDIKKLSIVALFSSFALALISTIWSLYVNSFVNDIAKVGLITSFFAIISFFARFAVVPIIEKNDKSKLYIISLYLIILAYILLAITKNFWLFLIIGVAATVFGILRIATFGIIIKDTSKKKELPKNEGILFTFLNISFLIAPLVAGFIAAEYSMRYVFVLSATMFLMALIIFKSFSIRDEKKSKKIHTNYIKNFIDFFKSKDRIVAYCIAGGVQLWWSLIYGFIPLYIIQQNLNEKYVGYFLFFVVIPLILFEYKFSTLTNKKGFKKMFVTGFLIAAFISIVCFFIDNIFVILILLVLASIGLAMIEPTIEAYFFITTKEEDRFYSPYQTSMDVAFFTSRIVSAFILFFLPFKFLFLLFGIFMFLLTLISTKTNNYFKKNNLKATSS